MQCSWSFENHFYYTSKTVKPQCLKIYKKINYISILKLSIEQKHKSKLILECIISHQIKKSIWTIQVHTQTHRFHLEKKKKSFTLVYQPKLIQVLMIKISAEKWACGLFTWSMREMRGRRRGRLGRHWDCQLCCNGSHTHTRTLGYNTERRLSHTCQGYSVVVEKAKGRRSFFL